MFTEAFKELDLLCEEDFNLNDDADLKELKSFKDDDENISMSVIDPEADTEEDLSDSYVGKVVLECPVCHSKIYKDREDVVLDENGEWANEDEECPMCLSEGGFKIVGEIAPYKDEDTEGIKVSVDEKEVKVEPDEEEEVNESLDEGILDKFKKQKKVAREEPNEDSDYNNEHRFGVGEFEKDKWRTTIRKGLTREDAWKLAQEENAKAKKLGEPYTYRVLGEECEKEGFLDNPLSNIANGNTLNLSVDASGAHVPFLGGVDNAKDDNKNESLGEEACPKCGKNPCECEHVDESILGLGLGALAGGLGAHALGAAGAGTAAAAIGGGLLGNALTKEESCEGENKESLKEENDPNVEFMSEEEAVEYWINNHNSDPVLAEYKSIIDWLKDSKENGYIANESLKEGFEHVNVETDKQTMDMTQSEDGTVVVTTSPKKEEPVEGGDEMLAPVGFDTAADIVGKNEDSEESEELIDSAQEADEANAEDEMEAEVDDFDEESFNTVGESFLRNTYSNVKSFNTSRVRDKNNSLIVEGIIEFESGAKKKTSFVFEANSVSKADNTKVNFLGENLELTKGNKAFRLNGKIVEGKFITESLAYDFENTKGIEKA